MAHKVITPTAQEPIPIEELRAHLRIEAFGQPAVHPDDASILDCLAAAREHAEMYVGYALTPQVWEVALDGFPPLGAIELKGGTVHEIVSVSYVDADGNRRSMDASSYVLDSYSSPNWLLLADGAAWPAARAVANGVRVRYAVGHDPLPRSIRSALKLIVGHLYVNRESVVVGSAVNELPMGVYDILRPFRLMGA